MEASGTNPVRFSTGVGTVQYKKLTPEQRRIKRWRARRNALVSRLLSEDPKLLRHEALSLANRMMRESRR